MSRFAENVKALRKKLSMTQAELAERVSITQSAVSMYESETAAPNPVTLVKLAKALNVTVEELVCLEGDSDA